MKKLFKFFLFKNLIWFFESKNKVYNYADFGICTLLCHRDVDLFIYNLMSLFYQLKRIYPIFIVNDGTLTTPDIFRLKRLFKIHVESSISADKKMRQLLSKHKHFYEYRFDPKTVIFKKKFDAYLLCPFSRFLYLDADILFYRYPTQIASWIKENNHFFLYTSRLNFDPISSVPKDTLLEVAFRKTLYRNLSVDVNPTLSGSLIGFPNKRMLSLAKLDRIFKQLYEIGYVYTWLVEETALAVALNYYGFLSGLPPEEYVHAGFYDEYCRGCSQKTISLHYAHLLKSQFKTDAIKLAIKSRFFR